MVQAVNLFILFSIYGFYNDWLRLDKKNQESLELSKALIVVGRHYNISFSYNPQILPDARVKRPRLAGLNLNDALTELLKPFDLTFRVSNKTVAIYQNNAPVVALNKRDSVYINGHVLDSLTNKPIPGVNVFLSNTLIGLATDINGYFSFELPSNYNYEVVFSHVSYDPKIISIETLKGFDKVVVKLSENVDQLDEVVVTFSYEEWKNRLKIFTEEFIGTTRNSVRCEILNPEDIHFHFDKEKNLLTASSNELIQIRNEALGYIINHLIVDFKYQDGQVSYITKTKFEKLTHKNLVRERKWKKKRDDVYFGSLNHFIHALISNNLKEEGFEVYIVNSLEENRERKKFKLRHHLSKVDTLHTLRFTGFLEVIYKDLEDSRYKNHIDEETWAMIKKSNYEREVEGLRRQASIIEMNNDLGIVIIQDGQLRDPSSIIQHGYWGWKRTADLLPINYISRD